MGKGLEREGAGAGAGRARMSATRRYTQRGKRGWSKLQWRSHRFLGPTVKCFNDIVCRAGCGEECDGSRDRSAGLDESSVKLYKLVFFYLLLCSSYEAGTYLIVGYINTAELAVYGGGSKGINQSASSQLILQNTTGSQKKQLLTSYLSIPRSLRRLKPKQDSDSPAALSYP